MASPLPVIIDTDPGLGAPGSDIDDGLAIALALRSGELDVVGLTVVNGNVDLALGVDVARRLTSRLGFPDLPVLAGANAPLVRDMGPVREVFADVVPHAPSRGPDAGRLGPTDETHAADWLAAQAARRPGEIVVVAIGPMTNLALAVQRDTSFAANVKELVLMAGSATTYAENMTVVADFNAYVDPEALQIVLDSGARIRMVGLDQTSRVVLTREDAATLRAHGDELSTWVADCADAWIDFLGTAFPHRPEQPGAYLHDPLVVAAVLDERLLTWADAHVEAETSSELARGLVVADRGLALTRPKPMNAHVAIDTDIDAFHELFLNRLTQPVVAESDSLHPDPQPR